MVPSVIQGILGNCIFSFSDIQIVLTSACCDDLKPASAILLCTTPPIWDRLFLKRDSSCPLLVPLRRCSYWSSLLEAVGCCSLALSVLPLLKTSLYQPFAISEFISMHNRFVEYLCWEHTCFPHLGSTPFSALMNSWQVASNTSSNFTACFWATDMEEEDYGTWVSPQKRALCLLRIPGELIWPSLPFYLSSSLCMVFLYLDRLWLSSSSWTSKYLTRETFALEKKCLRICLMWFFSRLTRYSYMMEQWAWTGNIYSCFNLILNIFSSTASPAILFLHTSWFCCHLFCKIISFRGLLWRLKILQNVVFLFGGQFYIQLLNLKRNSRINNHRGDLKCWCRILRIKKRNGKMVSTLGVWRCSCSWVLLQHRNKG